MKKFPISIIGVALFAAACSGSHGVKTAKEEMLLKASATFDSIYSHYGVDGRCLLRENYPDDADYKASYLATEAAAERGNEFSYLWPYSGSLSAVTALYRASGDKHYLDILHDKVLPGLEEYNDTTRLPAAYASYIISIHDGDRFYDDNIWIGIDMTHLYELTGDTAFLDKARSIWDFIESGTDSILGGGIYWCEQKKHSKHTCSNAPGAVLATRLYEATADTFYLNRAEDLYEWTKSNLCDTTDCLYFDNMDLNGNISRVKYAYNSGQMLEAAVLLYNATGNPEYLSDAQAIAESAFRYFFNGGTAEDEEGQFPLLTKGNVWFTAIMMRGCDALRAVDGDNRYMEIFERNLDHAWKAMRDPDTGLFSEDWSGVEVKDRNWLLTQFAMAEMFANAARDRH